MQIIRFGNFGDKESGRPSDSTFRKSSPIRIHTSKSVLFYSPATELLYLSAFDINVFPARDGIHTSLLRFWAMPRAAVWHAESVRVRPHGTFRSTLTYADAIDARDGRDDCAMDGSG